MKIPNISDPNNVTLEFDTANSFFILVYIMRGHGFREVYLPGFPGLIKMVQMVEHAL